MAAPLDDIKRFLEAFSYRERETAGFVGASAYRPFVTISRQAGAGGHTLARVLLQQMQQEDDPLFHGWQVFDRELCEQLIADPALRISMQALLSEEYHTDIEDAIYSLLGGESPQYVVVKKLFETIRSLAAMGRVIVVGRGGMCVTRGLPDGVHVRLVASEATRLQRMRTLVETTEREAKELMARQDRDRARLIADYFHRDIDDPLLYVMMWNTDAAPMEAIAASLIAFMKRHAAAAAARHPTPPPVGRGLEVSGGPCHESY
ncbi:MAG: cytidylate kinase-like family protein [Candidatus Omnitrophica bacterium]|nr:cytidylate kinase-like family protein [Candidatus Omnitrophota bacterium]